MAKPAKTKPSKPYPTFPLTPHANGQWCKKIHGKVRFFGVWADPEAALNLYHSHAADLHAGREPSSFTVSGEEPTVKEVCNAYLGWQREKADAGEIDIRSYKECLNFVVAFGKNMGEHRAVTDLHPTDFQRYRMKLAKELAPATLLNPRYDVIALNNRPTECGKRMSCFNSMVLPHPIPHVVVDHSPVPSAAMIAARSNAEGKNALAACDW